MHLLRFLFIFVVLLGLSLWGVATVSLITGEEGKTAESLGRGK